MKIEVKIKSGYIEITEKRIDDVYVIIQDDVDGRFYITSNNGYNGFEGNGDVSFDIAFNKVKKMIKNYFIDRGESNPKGF